MSARQSAAAAGFNPASEYEEATVVDGITLYDIHRKPRVADSESTVRVSAASINTELTCPVCMNIMRKTTIVKECLHRFCHDCISKSLRLLKKECPKCRVPVATKRHLEPDPVMDQIIAAIYPSLDEYEAARDSAIEEANKTIQSAYTTSCSHLMQRQASVKRKRASTSSSSGAAAAAAAAGGAAAAAAAAADRAAPKGKRARLSRDQQNYAAAASSAAAPSSGQMQLVAFVLKRHPNERKLNSLEHIYFRSEMGFTVWHVKKFLALKLATSDERFDIVCPPTKTARGKRVAVLEDEVTLRELSDTFPGGHVQLHYRSQAA